MPRPVMFMNLVDGLGNEVALGPLAHEELLVRLGWEPLRVVREDVEVEILVGVRVKELLPVLDRSHHRRSLKKELQRDGAMQHLSKLSSLFCCASPTQEPANDPSDSNCCIVTLPLSSSNAAALPATISTLQRGRHEVLHVALNLLPQRIVPAQGHLPCRDSLNLFS